MFKEYNQKLREWANRHSDSRHSRIWLGFLAFTDACCSPVPPDILLIPMLLIKNTRWLSVAVITAGLSVIGGIVGYGIGFFLFDTVGQWVLNTYSLQDEFVYVGDLFNKHAFITIFIAAFTPIPYKVFTISGGFFAISFPLFMLASILGRFLRYFIMALLLRMFGEQILDFISKKFNKGTFVITLFLILVLLLVHFFL